VGNTVLSIETELIEKKDKTSQNRIEINDFKRPAAKIKSKYPLSRLIYMQSSIIIFLLVGVTTEFLHISD
jgi:hypothetical protein